MDWHRRSIRMGAAAILLAVVLRLYGTGAFGAMGEALAQPAASFMIYLETGRVVRPVQETEPEPVPAETAETTAPRSSAAPVFSADDAELVYVWGSTPEKVDPASLLEAPLDLDLTGDGPAVLILHTHATESYTMTAAGEYTETSDYRTLDPDYNMLAIGARVEELLEAAGIGVIHAETLHDYPNYTGAYDRSQATAEEILAEYPGIRLILDLHRDSAADGNGELDTSAEKDGRESAQLMLLMSTGFTGWEDNMNLAVKTTVWLEQTYPGITRGILTRNGDYNQNLGPRSMLVEVGAAGNTLEEALQAAEALAEAIIALSQAGRG